MAPPITKSTTQLAMNHRRRRRVLDLSAPADACTSSVGATSAECPVVARDASEMTDAEQRVPVGRSVHDGRRSTQPDRRTARERATCGSGNTTSTMQKTSADGSLCVSKALRHQHSASLPSFNAATTIDRSPRPALRRCWRRTGRRQRTPARSTWTTPRSG